MKTGFYTLFASYDRRAFQVGGLPRELWPLVFRLTRVDAMIEDWIVVERVSRGWRYDMKNALKEWI